MNELADDDRAVSESMGVAILIGMTILVTVTVGLNVLVVSDRDDGPPNATFSYDYIDSNSVLVITHVKGDEFPAGELVIEGPNAETTWAAVAGTNDSEPIGVGDITQISQGNAYGESVSKSTTVRIYHATGENRTRLSEWP